MAQSSALDFLRAYELCFPFPITYIPVGTPALICAALSAELGMKTLLFKEGRSAKGHNLKKLLRKLSSSDRDEIIALTKPSWPDFEDQLENAQDAFVDWRYIFEAKEDKFLNTRFVGTFAKAIYQVLEAKSISGHSG